MENGQFDANPPAQRGVNDGYCFLGAAYQQYLLRVEVVQKFDDDLTRKDFEVKIGRTAFDIEISPFSTEIFQSRFSFSPKELDRSIWFEGETVPAP
jgi:hypothetical protein